jgi:hypothetical protein
MQDSDRPLQLRPQYRSKARKILNKEYLLNSSHSRAVPGAFAKSRLAGRLESSIEFLRPSASSSGRTRTRPMTLFQPTIVFFLGVNEGSLTGNCSRDPPITSHNRSIHRRLPGQDVADPALLPISQGTGWRECEAKKSPHGRTFQGQSNGALKNAKALHFFHLRVHDCLDGGAATRRVCG